MKNPRGEARRPSSEMKNPRGDARRPSSEMKDPRGVATRVFVLLDLKRITTSS